MTCPHKKQGRCASCAKIGKNNPMYGRTHSYIARLKCSKSKIAEKNPMWVGEKIGYSGIHSWVRLRFPKPRLCCKCKSKPPMDLANISQKYKRDISDWEWLCRKCHMIKDGRLNRLHKAKRKSLLLV